VNGGRGTGRSPAGPVGAAGVLEAPGRDPIEQAFPKALRQRCPDPRGRNVLAKAPPGCRPKSKDAYYWKLFDTEDLTTKPRPEAR
jgi:hypothetical protein